jgi:DNA-binding MarR family transcriptional regulator
VKDNGSQVRPSRRRKATPKRKAVKKADYEALAEFRYALRKFLAFSETAAAQAGLTPQQHQALLSIKGAPNSDRLNISQIAERLLIRHHTAVELVDRLGALGLVAREADPADGRRVLVHVTEEGEERLRALSQSHIEEVKNIRPTLQKLLRQFRGKRSE